MFPGAWFAHIQSLYYDHKRVYIPDKNFFILYCIWQKKYFAKPYLLSFLRLCIHRAKYKAELNHYIAISEGSV